MITQFSTFDLDFRGEHILRRGQRSLNGHLLICGRQPEILEQLFLRVVSQIQGMKPEPLGMDQILKESLELETNKEVTLPFSISLRLPRPTFGPLGSESHRLLKWQDRILADIYLQVRIQSPVQASDWINAKTLHWL